MFPNSNDPQNLTVVVIVKKINDISAEMTDHT